MIEPTQSEKSITILKALGYAVRYSENDSFWLIHSNESGHHHWSQTEDGAWAAFKPFTSYEICFEEIVPMMEKEGFSYRFEDVRNAIIKVHFWKITDKYIEPENGDSDYEEFEEKNTDIRIAICEATYSYLKAEGKV